MYIILLLMKDVDKKIRNVNVKLIRQEFDIRNYVFHLIILLGMENVGII